VVKRWLQIWAWLVLAVWLPATQHCRLDWVLGQEAADPCCSPANAPVESSSCCDALCGGLEQGWPRNEETIRMIAAWSGLETVFVLGTRAGSEVADGPTELLHGSEVVAELSQRWCFLLRTAQPARAPDARS